MANNGNVMQVTDNLDATRTWAYTYDELNRIQTAVRGGSNGNLYSYDAWGNMQVAPLVGWGQSFALPADPTTNRIVGYCYDAAGNMTNDGACGQLEKYSYDAEGRMISANTGASTYTYDGDGTRVAKSDGTLYWLGQGDILAESDASGSIQREYVYFGGKRIARVLLGGGTQYYFSDHLGSTSLVVDSNSTILEDSDYWPFGREIPVTAGASDLHYKFTGKERDAESGLDNFGARFDSSNIGRFMSADPFNPFALKPKQFKAWISNPQRWNKYAYALNNPVTLIDPDGLNACGTNNDNTCKVTVTFTDRSKDENGNYNDKWANLKGNKDYNAVATVSVNGKAVGTFLADTVSSGNGKFATIQNGTYEGVLHFHHRDPNKPSIELLSGGRNQIPTTGPNPVQGGASFATDVLIHSAGGTKSNPLGDTGLLPNGHGVSEACQLVCSVEYQQFLGATGIRNADGSAAQQHFSVVVDTSENQ
jgi:RHS repeat-associated protein